MATSSTTRWPLGLLDLPAELRNKVYGYLFGQSEPFFVTRDNVAQEERGRVVSFRRVEYQTDTFTNRYQYDHEDDHDTVYKTPPVAVYHLAMPLMRTCKTIAAEAASLLYRNNTFTLIRPRVCSSEDRVENDENIPYIVGAWLEGLGNQTRELRRVQIDLGLFYRWGTPRGDQSQQDWNKIEISSLMRMLWTNRYEFKVCIVQTTKDSESNLVNSGEQFDGLNDAIALLQQGQLGLNTLCMVMYSLSLDISGLHGSFMSATTSKDYNRGSSAEMCRYGGYTERTIEFTYDGKSTLTLDSTKYPKLSLLNLPMRIQDRILKSAYSYQKVQKISIKNNENIIQATNPFSTCDFFHGIFYSWYNVFDIELETSSRDGRFPFSTWSQLSLLIQRVAGEHCYRYRNRHPTDSARQEFETAYSPWSNICADDENISCTIVFSLDLEAGEKIDPSTVRFDVIPFLHYTVFMQDDIIVNIDIRCANSGKTLSHVAFDLRTLRRRVVDIWTHIRSKHDRTEYPEVWVDAYGSAIEAKRPSRVGTGMRKDFKPFPLTIKHEEWYRYDLFEYLKEYMDYPDREGDVEW